MPLNSNLAAVEQRVRKLRQRTRFLGKSCFSRETLNESHARELVVRKLFLPRLKDVLGPRLKAVLIVGSSQIGIRKATSKNPKSDIDVIAVVEDSVAKENNAFFELADTPLRGECSKLGLPFDLVYRTISQFKEIKNEQSPFQVVYGRDFVSKTYGSNYADVQKLKRVLYAREKRKYKDR